MEKVVREYMVYDFEELRPEVQEKVINNFRYINVDFDWWDSDYYSEIAKEYGIKIIPSKMCFDIYEGWVAFDTFNHSYDNNWKVPIEIEDKEKFLKKAGVKDKGEIKINHKHYAGGYIKNFIEVAEGDYTEIDITKLQGTLEEMLSKILKALKEDYDYLTSDDAVKETIQINEFKFLENGELFK